MTILIEKPCNNEIPRGPVEYLELNWHERTRPRLNCVTDAGTPVALALARGTVLAEGMILHNSKERTIIVKSSIEEVVVIRPASMKSTGEVAHLLGNWHRSLHVAESGELITEPDKPLLDWLDRKKIEWRLEHRPYHPNLYAAAHD